MPSVVGTTLGAKGCLHILMYTNPNLFSSFSNAITECPLEYLSCTSTLQFAHCELSVTI